MSEREIDNELVKQVLKGDKEAFDILMLKYQRRIAYLISKIIDEPANVKDLTQDSFIRAYRSIHTFNGQSAFYTWLYRIAINTAKNHLKMRYRKAPPIDIDYEDAELLPGKYKLKDHATPERMLMRDELRTLLLGVINTLPEDLRTAFILREMAGLTYEEISTIMHSPVGTIRSRIYRAREYVDEKLQPWLESQQ